MTNQNTQMFETKEKPNIGTVITVSMDCALRVKCHQTPDNVFIIGILP